MSEFPFIILSVVTTATLLLVILYKWARRYNRQIISNSLHRPTPVDPIRPIPEEPPPDLTISVQIFRNDLPPSYEEVLEDSMDESGSQRSFGIARPSDIWIVGMTESQDMQNPPPNYWTSTHQPPEYPGVR